MDFNLQLLFKRILIFENYFIYYNYSCTALQLVHSLQVDIFAETNIKSQMRIFLARKGEVRIEGSVCIFEAVASPPSLNKHSSQGRTQ